MTEEQKYYLQQLLWFVKSRLKKALSSKNKINYIENISQIRGAILFFCGRDIGVAFLSLEEVARFLDVKYVIKGDEIFFSEFPDFDTLPNPFNEV